MPNPEDKLPIGQRVALASERLKKHMQTADHYSYVDLDGVSMEADTELLIRVAESVATYDTMTYDLWNGFSVTVTGHPKSIETARQHIESLAIVHELTLIRSIRVFSAEKSEYTTRMNYSEIKAARLAERARKAGAKK